ncbi:hypothetical protein Hanom_Chr11g00986831 [Helianthus anomalus]
MGCGVVVEVTGPDTDVGVVGGFECSKCVADGGGYRDGAEGWLAETKIGDLMCQQSICHTQVLVIKVW